MFKELNDHCARAFGDLVQYTPSSTGVPLDPSPRAILELVTDEEKMQEATYALLFMSLSDLPIPPESGDTVVVDEKTYVVYDVASDGIKGQFLRLRR